MKRLSSSDHTTTTTTNDRMSSPRLIGTILDSNGANLLGQAAIASAVNYLAVQNGATGNAVWLYPVGTDTNVDLTIAPKGSGAVKLGTGATVVGTTDTQTLTNKTLNSTTNTVIPRNIYKFAAWASATTTLGATAFTKIAFATEEYDSNSNFASSTYTAPVAGFYTFKAAIEVTSGAAGEFYILAFYKNGVEFKRSMRISTGVAAAHNLVGSIDLQLAATNTVDVYVYNGTGAGKTVSLGQATTYFQGHLFSL